MCKHVCLYVCVCVYIYIYIYIHVYLCMCIYIYACLFMDVYIYAIKLKKAQYQVAGIYLKEQTEYIQNHRDKIRDSVEDRQSRIAWQTINEVSRRKSTTKAKLKAANQQERIKLWKQHFENLLGNPPKVTHEPITRIISQQLDIKIGPFTQEELDSVLRKIKNKKSCRA